MGVGASVAVIVSDNTYQAYLGDDAYADVGSLTIKAGNNNIDTPVPFAYERFADLDLQVLLSSSNYYTEALAGTATEQTAVSGSFVINFLNDTIEAYIGEYAQIESSGPVRVQAVWDATVRAVSGGMTAGFKVGVGTAFTNIVNSTSVLSALKTYAAVYEASSVGITAAAHTQIGAFAASAAATGSTAVTGVSSLIVSNNRVEARADEYARLYAPLSPMIPGETRSGSVFITAENMYKSWNIAGDAAGGGDAGVGGAHATNLISNTTLAVIDRGTEVGAFHGIDAAAVSQQDMTTIAAGGVGAGSVGVAGSTVENVIDTTTHAWVAEGVHMNPQWSSLPQIVHPEQYVRIQAADATEMINVAGGAAFGGKTGVGMGLDVTVIDKNTQAFIFSTGDPPTYVNVYHTLEVAAKASQNVTSVVGGLGGGGTVGVSGVNAVYTVTNLTRSYIGAMAQVNSRRNVLVTADDENDLRLIVGNAAFGPSAGVGAAGAIVVVDKITEAYIDAVASVTALGKGTGVMAHTGLYDVSYSPLGSGSGHIGRPDYNVHNLTGDTLAAGDDAVDNPSMTQERSATPQQREVQGIAVTAVTKDQIESIAVGGTAAGGVAVSAAATVTVVTNTTRAFIDEGAWINGDNADAAPEQTVFVAAGSDFYHLGIAGTLAGAATAGVGPGADISVVRNNTEAFIGAWSMVNAAGDIAVEAYAHEDILSIPAAAAGGGSAGVAGGASINVIGNATQAYIADAAYVIADGNVGIRADDTTEIDVIAGSLGIGGGAGVGQALDVTVIEKETSAFVGERAVVEARGVNGGYLQAYTSEKTADGQWVAHGVKGLLVQASSREDVFNVTASGGAGIWAGVAGAVTVNIINSRTTAYVDDAADINADLSAAGSAQSVHIAAVNNVQAKSITGSVGGAFVGVSGAVDIGIIKNAVTAYTGWDTALQARDAISVVAGSAKDLSNYSLGHAGGMAGTTGGVAVWTIGADLDWTAETPAGRVGEALTFEDGSIEGFIDHHLFAAGEAKAAARSGEAPEDIGSSFADLGFVNVVDFLLGGYLEGPVDAIIAVRDMVLMVLQSLAGSGLVGDDVQERSDAKAGVASAAPTGTIAGLSGQAVGREVVVAAYEDVRYNQLVVGASTGAVTAGAAVGINTLHNTTVAYVDTDAVIRATDAFCVDSRLTQTQKLKVITGTLGFFGSLGGAVVGLTDTGGSYADIGVGAQIISLGDVQVAADTINTTDMLAVNAGTSMGAVNGTVAWVEDSGETAAAIASNAEITAGGDLIVSAGSYSARTADAYAPSVGAFLGLGAVWVELTDARSTSAMVRSDAAIWEADTVMIQASHTPYLAAYAGGAGTGAAAVGAAVGRANVVGVVEAGLDKGVQVARLEGSTVDNLFIRAQLQVASGKDVSAEVVTDSAAASPLIAGSGSDAVTLVAPRISAYVAGDADVQTRDNVDVAAVSYAGARAISRGLNIAGLSAGLAFSEAILQPRVEAFVGYGTTISAGKDMTIAARHNTDAAGRFLDYLQAYAKSAAATVSLAAGGTGADADADASAIVEAYVADTGAVLKAGEVLTVQAASGNKAYAEADGQAYSTGLGVGAVFADALTSGRTTAYVDAVQVQAGAFGIEAKTQDHTEALTKSGAGGIAAGSGSIATAVAATDTIAYTGNSMNAIIDGDFDITAEHQAQATADALGAIAGGATVGVSSAVARIRPLVRANLGMYNNITADNLAITALTKPGGESYGGDVRYQHYGILRYGRERARR